MRALAAILLAACLQAHAQASTRDAVHRTLRSLLGNQYEPIQRLFTCAQTLGTTKCLNALSLWRAERALQSFSTNQTNFNLTEDVERFPWMKYSNASEEELYSKLCDGTEKVLQHRSLILDVIPGYELQLDSKGNGTVNFDVLKSNEAGRGKKKKKLQKMFYNIMPLLALPGLIMAAILPFILPGLKMMTLAAGMLNNMALMGAVFTLLRNNAFNDKYQHKIVYVNKGYENEKHLHEGHFTNPEEHIHSNHEGLFYSDDKLVDSGHPFGEDFDSINEVPPDIAWIPPNRAILRSHTISPQGFAKN